MIKPSALGACLTSRRDRRKAGQVRKPGPHSWWCGSEFPVSHHAGSDGADGWVLLRVQGVSGSEPLAVEWIAVEVDGDKGKIILRMRTVPREGRCMVDLLLRSGAPRMIQGVATCMARAIWRAPKLSMWLLATPRV